MSGVQTAEAKSHKCGTAKEPSLEEEKNLARFQRVSPTHRENFKLLHNSCDD